MALPMNDLERESLMKAAESAYVEGRIDSMGFRDRAYYLGKSVDWCDDRLDELDAISAGATRKR